MTKTVAYRNGNQRCHHGRLNLKRFKLFILKQTGYTHLKNNIVVSILRLVHTEAKLKFQVLI